MPLVRKVKSRDLQAQLERDIKALVVDKTDEAIAKTAAEGVAVARKNAPEAFSELRDGIVATDTAIQSTAPHAAPVEVGSRPHRPPFAPILAWVRLRGMQGVHGGGEDSGAPAWVAGRIRERGTDTTTPVDAAERVAWAVVHKIERDGTKPNWYMQRSVPEVFALLDANMKAALLGG